MKQNLKLSIYFVITLQLTINGNRAKFKKTTSFHNIKKYENHAHFSRTIFYIV